MANSLGNAYVKIRGDIEGLQGDLDKALSKIKGLESKVDASNKNMASSFDKVQASIKRMGDQTINLSSAVKALGVYFAALQAINIADNFIKTASTFENLNTQLKTILGSSAAAQQALLWITDFTAKTPYELEEVSKAFIKLSAHGLTAIDWMKTLGDTASSMGKSLDQTVDMFTDAMTGEFERLKEYGVKAKSEGEKVTFAWAENGKAMVLETQKNSESISTALGQIFQRFNGGMDEMSKTWTGMMSNLSDNWSIFKKSVMDSGPFESLKLNLKMVLDKIEELKKSGQFDKIARETGAVIVEVIAKIITALGWLPTAFFSVIEAVDKTTAYIVAMGQAAVNATAFIAAAINPLNAYQVATEGFRETFPALASANDTLENLGAGLYNSGEAASRSAQKFATFGTYMEGVADNIRKMADTTPKAVQGTDLLTGSTDKATTAHKASSAEMKKAADAANKYIMVIDELNGKLAAMNGDEYSKKIADIERQFLSYAKTVGAANDVLQKWYDTMKSQAGIDSMKEVLDIEALNAALKDLDSQYAQLSMTKLELMDYELSVWYENERIELMKNNAVSQEAIDLIDKIYEKKKKLNEELKDKEIWEGFSTNGKEEISDIAEHWEKENKKAAESAQKIWDKAWKNIESSFADSIYDMMENGIDSFDDFFDNILKMFEKLLAEMVSAWLVSGLKTLLTGGEGAFSLSSLFNLGSTGVSATDAAEGALSLASAYDSLVSGITAVTDALGLTTAAVTTAAESAAAAAAVQATSTAAAAATMEGIANSAAAAATATEALGAAAVETSSAMTNSVAAFEAMESSMTAATAAGGTASAEMGAMSTLGAAAAVAGVVYFIGSGEFQSMVEGLFMGGSPTRTTNEDMYNALKAAEAGSITLDKATTDLYKTAILWESFVTGYYGSIQEMFDNGELNTTIEEWIESNQELLSMTMAEYDKIMSQQEALMDSAYNMQQYGMTTDTMGTQFVEVAVKIAEDATMPLEQKMYQLGFVASQSGGWETDATMAMLAEFSDQGIPWSEINKTMIAYGVTDETLLKDIYVNYNNVSDKESLAIVEEYLALNNLPDEVSKTVKYIYDSNVPMEDVLSWLTAAVGYGGAGLSEADAIKLMGIIDPSDEWYDLVIPVDAPESIPLTYDPSMQGMASGGPVSAGTPYIIGEVGPELFIPQQSGHILSNENMMRLSSMGVQGFASGTTNIPYSATAVDPRITVNITNNTGGAINSSNARISRNDQGIIVDLIVDAIERNVGGRLRPMIGGAR